MQIKIFHLRLSAPHAQSDQDEMNAFLRDKKFKKSSSQFVAGAENFWSVMVFYEDQLTPVELPAKPRKQAEIPLTTLSSTEEKSTVPQEGKALPAEEILLTPEEEQIYQTLRHWRQTKAEGLGLPVFIVAHNSELMNIARSRPSSMDAFSAIKGFGTQKTEKYGEEILAVLNAL
jgi:superfamily II DNA helicase RecQ